MRILVLNSGSSSIKFSIFESGESADLSDPKCLCDGEVSGLGTASAQLRIRDRDGRVIPGLPNEVEAEAPGDALKVILESLKTAGMETVHAIGYRVVHPGPKLQDHQKVTAEVLADLEEASSFAPLHDPAVVALIKLGMASFPDVSHYACFDTVFHQTMPEEAVIYPIPNSFRDMGVRRYGFHGLSCESVVRQLAAQPGGCPERMVIAHLGSGCSVTALRSGRSVDTSMGLTPTGGIVMGTRPGDLDPGLVLFLLRNQSSSPGQAASALEALLNHQSGLVALSGMPNDVRALRQASADGNAQATLALQVFTRTITKALGGFCWLLGGLDAIVFTGGIGEHDPRTRSEVLASVQGQQILVSPQLNEHTTSGINRVSTRESPVTVLVIPAQEDLMIAVHVTRMAQP